MQVTIDNRDYDLPDGVRMNAVDAARRAGVEIPHYCYHPGLKIVGSCRMCLVQIGTRDPATGEVRMQPRLVPGCNTIVTEGMVIVTQAEKVRQARAMVEEGLLLRHPIDCPICDKAGECLLQDYYFQYGRERRRADLMPFTSRRRDLGDVFLFVDRCILCTRCVRFCEQISGTCELMVANRGAHEEIDVVPGHPLSNNLSGNVVDLCPVGALADKDFLYRQRVWFMRRHPGVCTGCAVGCSIWIEENQDRIYRLKPRENMAVNRWWICNAGRYCYHHVHDPRRLKNPLRREAGRTVEIDWTGLPTELRERLRAAGRLGGVLSPYLSVEEAYLLAKLLRGLDPKAVLALGPVPTVGEDERYPGGFSVSAEKAPNRRGVEEVLAHFMRRVMTFEEFLAELGRGELQGVWVTGGYVGLPLPPGEGWGEGNRSPTGHCTPPSPPAPLPQAGEGRCIPLAPREGEERPWIDEPTARRFEGLRLLVVQDLFPSPLSARATYELPGAAFAERDGSYVNRVDRLQTSRMAVRPPWGVRTEASLYWEMLQNRGLFDHRVVLDELSRKIVYFAVAAGAVPDGGVDLRIHKLA